MPTTTHTPPPYPAYQHAGLPWLDEAPAHWRVVRGKTFMQKVDVRSQTGDEELLTVSAEHGVIPRESAAVTMFKAESYEGYKLCWPGDLVINSLWAWAHGLGIAKHHGIVSSAYGVYRLLPGQQNNPEFIHYLVRSIPFQWELQVRSKGIWISRLKLTDESFLSAPFPLPPPGEQAAIVRYLDAADAGLRQRRDARRRLLALRREEKQALIHQAVTQGLRPNAPTRPAALPYLGPIPAHWEVRRLRNLAEMRVSNVDKHTNDNELPVRLCNYVDVYKNDRITQDLPFMSATASPKEIERFRLERDDVIITKDSETWDDIGVPAVVTEPADDLICGYHLALLRPYQQISGPYLFRALQSNAIGYQFHTKAKGVTRYGLSHNDIKSVAVPVPPPDEQAEIVAFLEGEMGRIDAAMARDRRLAELYDEYRIRLMADAVTGRLDLRQAPEPASLIPPSMAA